MNIRNNVNISSDISTNRKIKIGMLIYRLTGPGGGVHYLEPTIIRDFESGNSYHTDTDYQPPNDQGAWGVEAYLCIGQCNIKGDAPPKNIAVSATGGFTVSAESEEPPTQGGLNIFQ